MANTPTFSQIADAMAKIKAQENTVPPPSPAAKDAMDAAYNSLRDTLEDIALSDFDAAADAVGDATKQLQSVIDSGAANADPIRQILGSLGSAATGGAAPAAGQAAQGGAQPAPAPASGAAQGASAGATNGSSSGFDAAFDCSSVLNKAKAAGIKFICRYYSHSAGKNLTASEAKLISAAGISLASVWETNPTRYSFFSFDQGVADGTSANNMARQVGQPFESAIYFAVDYDAGAQELNQNISEYFKGVRQGLWAATPGNPTYEIGAYGSGLTCSTLLQNGLATKTWLACSRGWRGSRTFSNWNIKQSLPGDPWGFGKQVDPDVAAGNFGAFSVP